MAITLNGTTGINQSSITGAAVMPVGTTAQRPVSPDAGMYRLNTTTGGPEWYDTGTGNWVVFSNSATQYSGEYLVVAGGGGGGNHAGGGGGGAGGYIASTFVGNVGASYSITIGAGGTSSSLVGTSATNGGDSAISFVATAIGGGRGGYSTFAPASGGSGGGANNTGYPAGTGTTGQGFAGGTIVTDAIGGGGGGALEAGSNGSSSVGGGGGDGKNWQDLGTFYSGGGGGGAHISGATEGAGGNGGGGAGAPYGTVDAVSGSINTGGGGGGAGGRNGINPSAGGAGGSGIVIIRYLGVTRASGGTITSSGGYTYHTFTSSGTFTA